LRILSRLIALAVALVLVVGGLLVAVEIVVAEVANGPWVIPYDEWYRNARTNGWSSTSTRQVALAMTAAGAVLLLVQLARRRPAVLEMEAKRRGQPTALSRRGVERSLERSVSKVDGVASAKVRISSKRARVTTTSHRRLPGDLEARVTAAAEQRLSALRLAQPLPLSVRLQTRSGR
jgi:hypothetical protein